MQTLKSEQRQIPNGFRFRQPEIKWDSMKVLGMHPSLDTLTQAVISARRANPHHMAQHNWSLDFDVVKQEVKQFNVRICQAMGWTEYLTEGGSDAPPFNPAQSLLNQKQLSAAVDKVKKLWAGVKTANDWLDSGEPPVPQELSEARAAVCVQCHFNGQGDFTAWFTKPASGAIKRQLERLTERNISTTQDAKLNICTACLCPMKLKVHTPMTFIKPHLKPEVVEELKGGKNCWILSEMGA